MEEENAIKEKQGSYVTGVIGAIIGGSIATIPWILAYVYGGMMLSILAALIAAGEFYGYKILKGRINKGLPAILMVLALIIVTVATLVVIPGLLIQKEGINVSITNIQRLYENQEFTTAMMKDFAISVIFTILGASIITSNIKKQIQNSDGNEKNIKLELNNSQEAMEIRKSAIELVKPVFEKYKALDPENTILKEEVLAEIESQRAKQSFNYLKQQGIIKKIKGKFYYSEEDENKQENKKMATWKKIFLIIVIILFAITMVAAVMDNTTTSNVAYQDEHVSFEIGKEWNKSESEHENEWDFYKYINTVPVLNSENTISDNDYSSYPAGINVYYDKTDGENVKSIEDIKTNLQTNFDNMQDKPDTLDMNILKTTENYDLLKVKIIYNSQPEEILYYYYVLNEDELLCITAFSFNLKDETAIEKEADKLVNSFKWL